MPDSDLTATVASLRTDHAAILGKLTASDAVPDPLRQFAAWLTGAIEAGLPDANAMTLATAGPDARPSARIVLLRGYDQNGFVFYTNYHSRKGRELTANPFASLVLFWPQLQRQIRIEGSVQATSPEESDAYFRTRPAGSRIGALASNQSEVILGREVLEQRVRELTAQYCDTDLPRPDHWGGYRVVPDSIEFWQRQPNRLHDRLLYTREKNVWRISRLSP